MRLHVLHVSVYCCHHQVYRAFTIALLSICYAFLHWPVFTLVECVVQAIGIGHCIFTCVHFRTVSEIELFHCTVPKLLLIKRYYALFVIPVFIVQVTNLVQFN
jgi:hypothetical protein